VLTKVTKWCAGVFFGLAIALTIMGTAKTTGSAGNLQRIMNETRSTVPTAPPMASSNVVNPATTNVVAPTSAPALNLKIPQVPAPEPAK
jgi:hypothetical protein